MDSPALISVVIPALNEANAIGGLVESLRRMKEVLEVIVVDGGSSDGTSQKAAEKGARIIISPPGRGGQLRLGAAAARGEIIWMIHADMEIPLHAGREALVSFRDPKVVGGGFWKTFKERRIFLYGSRFKCWLRFHLFGRFMADQAIFVSAAALKKIGGIPAVPLMEEFELCRLLKKQGKLCLANATVKTSARRFLENGVLRTYARMWDVTLRYYMGESPEQLKERYERK